MKIQLYLGDLAEPLIREATVAGHTISKEIRNRVKRTFDLTDWLDRSIADCPPGEALLTLIEVRSRIK